MITVLTGSNTHALREKLAGIKRGFKDAYGENGIELYTQEQLKPEDVSTLVSAASLFASKRLVIVEDLSQNKAVAELLNDVLSQIPEDTHLVLVEPALDKRTSFYKTLKMEADFQEFNELDEQGAIAWVADMVKEGGGEISQPAARMLVRYVGTSQLRLSHEIAKLLVYNPKIAESAIEELVEKTPEETIFQLLDFALSGRTHEAMRVLEGLEAAHEDPFQAVSMLTWQTHILAVVASALEASDSELAKVIKANPFVIKKTRTLAGRMSKQKLEHILSAVAETDAALKSTSVNPWRVLEKTILQLNSLP